MFAAQKVSNGFAAAKRFGIREMGMRRNVEDFDWIDTCWLVVHGARVIVPLSKSTTL